MVIVLNRLCCCMQDVPPCTSQPPCTAHIPLYLAFFSSPYSLVLTIFTCVDHIHLCSPGLTWYIQHTYTMLYSQVDMFDLRDGSKVGTVQAARDTVNGVHLHPYLPLMATASGVCVCFERGGMWVGVCVHV